MPLRHRLKIDPETVQHLVLAGDERYWEGVELLSAGYSGGGIYCLGYVAEMTLKRACFVLDGARPNALVGPRLRPIRTWARTRIPHIPHKNYHSLWFWVHVLREKRRLAGRQLPPLVDAQLVQRTRRLFGIWTVEMRYRPDRSLPQEIHSVYDDVTWLRDRRHLLGA